MRIAAIDIGTNTILMLVAEADGGSIRSILRDEHTIARLGKGVDEHRVIQPETIERVERCLSSYRSIADSLNVERLIAFGTSALRDAKNQDEFISRIKKTVGITISTLSREEEALLTFRGALPDSFTRNSSTVVVDIGGGSTEIAVGTGDAVTNNVSLDMGSVRLTERFLKHSPPSSEAIQEARNFVRKLLTGAPAIHADATFVGVAGTLTTLAAIDLDLQIYDRAKVDGYRLGRKRVDREFERLCAMTVEQIAAVPQILPERADILLAGILILEEILEHYGQNSIVVSDRGLRFGILMREAERLAGR